MIQLQQITLRRGQKILLNEANLTIYGQQKVSEVEQLFQDVYGLSVQVFRKSGTIWLETTATDDWTLNKQNDEAKELSSPINE